MDGLTNDVERSNEMVLTYPYYFLMANIINNQKISKSTMSISTSKTQVHKTA
jgi:hypothetical protein